MPARGGPSHAGRVAPPGGPGGGEVDPRGHRVEALGEEVEVSVLDPGLPGHDDRGVAPAGRTGQERRDAVTVGRGSVGLGEDVGHPAVGPLVGPQVPQPLGREPGDVVEERGGRGEQLPVTRPARPLPLGAIGGHVTGVVPEAPDRGIVQPVQPVVAAGEPPGADQIGVDDDAGHVVDGQRSRVAVDADVPEPMGGVAGLEPVLGPAPGHDRVHLAGRQRLAGGEVERAEVVGRHRT